MGIWFLPSSSDHEKVIETRVLAGHKINVGTCRCSQRLLEVLRGQTNTWAVQVRPGRAEGRAASRQMAGLGASCLMGVLPATSLQSRILLLGETVVLACPSGMPLSSQMSDSREIPQ